MRVGGSALMVRVLILGLCLAAVVLAGPSTPLERARELYNHTEYESALKTLNALPAKSAEAYLLMGQCHYMMGDPKKASEFFEKAVALGPSDTGYLWLGRAMGRRAETSSFITAPGYASQARQHFEKAVALNPKNLEAISDLFEYYLEAPGFLGGGLDKAAKLAQRIGQENPAEYYWAQSRLAEKRKEYQTAEQQLRRAVDLAPRQVGRVVDLARFLAKSGRYKESDEAFQQAARIDPNAPKLLFARARTYIESGRNLGEARQLLQRYLSADLTPDDPPRKEAERLLSKLGPRS
jgi:tetratricopeptide (TPR) repeat protein